MNISLDLYRIFCTVVRTGNMTAAARELFITQPAVSMAMRQLEEALGGQLLFRTTKGVKPTAEGQVLYTYLVQAMQLMDNAEHKYKELVELGAGELSIGASDTVIANVLLHPMERFHADYPNINIKVTNKTTYESLRLLQNGTVDLCFVNLPVAEDERLEIFPCMEIHDCLICGRKYRRLAETGLTWKQLGAYPLLLLEPLSNSRRFQDAFALKNKVALNPIIELGSSDLLLEFARIGLGLTFGVREFTDFSTGQLFEIPMDPPVPVRNIGMVKLTGVELSRAAKTFAQYIGN